MTDLIESEDELLDPQPGPVAATPPNRMVRVLHRLRNHTPLGSTLEADPDRRRRRTMAGLLAVALVAGAAATGVAVHSRDVHGAHARVQDRTLLHLLGGSATLSFGGDGTSTFRGDDVPGDFQTPLQADFTVALRNDGAKPLDVTDIKIAIPGVDVLGTAPLRTLAPGEAEAFTSRIDVRCTAADLPQYPSGVAVTVRTAAAKGVKTGAPTTVPLAFDPGHPATPEADGDSTSADSFMLGSIDPSVSSVTSSLYRLCGEALTMIPSRVSATAVSGSPSPQNPVVNYTLHIDNNPAAAQMAVPQPEPPTVPGVSAQTDLAGAQQIGTEGLDVNVTDRITDCKAFGDYLAVHGGAPEAAAALNAATPIGLQPVDPRFRTTPTQLASAARPEFDGLTPGTADLQATLLTQLAAVCPDL